MLRLKEEDLQDTLILDNQGTLTVDPKFVSGLNQIEAAIMEEVSSKVPEAITNDSNIFDWRIVSDSNYNNKGEKVFGSYSTTVNELITQDFLKNVIWLLKLSSDPQRVLNNEAAEGDIGNTHPRARLSDLASSTNDTIPGMELVREVLRELAQKVLDREEAKRPKTKDAA